MAAVPEDSTEHTITVYCSQCGRNMTKGKDDLWHCVMCEAIEGDIEVAKYG